MQPTSHKTAECVAKSQTGGTLTLRDVDALCATPWGLEAFSPLLDHRFLMLDAGSAASLTVASLEAIAHRLRQLPVPVIAVGKVSSPALLRGVDVILPAPQDASAIIANIIEHPLAAMTVVQLLRHNEDVAPAQGLFAESLAYASLQGGPEFARAFTSAPEPGMRAQEPDCAVLVERTGDDLGITLNRPHARNAYSTAMRDGLYDALQLLRMDERLRRAVVRGAGTCFCIGGDLREFGTRTDVSSAHAVRSSRNVASTLLELGSRLEFHLHRACIGSGIEIPAFAARVVANSNTFVQLPEIKLGLLPGAGGTVSILRRIGRHRTAYLALSARRINAATALQWGLVDAVI
jgi:enoyl-CoA hydratase